MKPDLGQHLWQSHPAQRNKPIVVYPAYPLTFAEASGGTFDVSFAYYPDDDDPLGGFIGTLNTRQSLAELAALCEGGAPVVIVGRLAPNVVTGGGAAAGVGGHYRLFRGRVALLPTVPGGTARCPLSPHHH